MFSTPGTSTCDTATLQHDEYWRVRSLGLKAVLTTSYETRAVQLQSGWHTGGGMAHH
jgi:hypothetical protein